jgi:hypothetical protein
LTFAFGEGLDAGSIGFAGAGTSVDGMAEASQLALGGGAVAERSVGVEVGGGTLQLGYRALGATGFPERTACESRRVPRPGPRRAPRRVRAGRRCRDRR